MPLINRKTSKDRVNFEGSLAREEIESLIHDPDIKYVQTSVPAPLETWDAINRTLLIQRPDIELHVYGFYNETCNLSFLQRLENIKRLSVDCIQNATGIENISALRNLESLSIGIFNLENLNFLQDLDHEKITDLALAATRSERPDLSCLSQFINLKNLYLEGQQKGIESISALNNLEKLVLHSISVANLDFIKDLPSLWSMDIKFGGTKNLTALAEKDSIKYIGLWQVQGMDDISVISAMTGLQYFLLQSLPRIISIPDLSWLKDLRRVYLENLKGLKDVSGIEAAPALEEFIHVAAQGMHPSQYEGILKKANLKKISVGFENDKKNKAFLELLEQNNIAKYTHHDFEFIHGPITNTGNGFSGHWLPDQNS